MTKKFQTTRRNLLRAAGVGAGLSLGGAGLLSEGVQLGKSTSSSVQPWIIENFEDGDVSEYNFVSGESNATIATDRVYDGSHALKVSGDAKLFRPKYSRTPTQGTKFSGRVKASNGSPLALFTYGVQDKNNFYAARLRYDTDKISVLKKENGSWTELTGHYPNFTFKQNQWYEIQLSWTETGDHVLTVSGDGNSAAASSIDGTWSTGGIGFWCFGGGSGVVHFDYVIEKQRQVDGIEVENFEDGNLDEYSIYSGESAASITDSVSYTRDKALVLADSNVNMSNIGTHLSPESGDTFSVRVRMSGAPISLFHYGVQDQENWYSLRIRPSTNEISILKHESGGWTELTGNTTSFDLKSNVWYQLELEWNADGEHTLTVSGDGHSHSTSCSCIDTTWVSGGIGFMQYGSSGDVTYFDSVQMEPILGNYEASRNNWLPTGPCLITTKSIDEKPAPVTRGRKSLQVTVPGESHPSIECQDRVAPANCRENPYLLADVLPATVENSESPVTFQFRYHHTNPGGVEESPEMTVTQSWGHTLAWDMSHLSDAKLSSPDRIEIAWYPTDHPPSSGFDYNGRVFFDNVRLSNNRNEVSNGMNMQKHTDLERAHGARVNKTITSQSDTVREGEYEYYDGTTVPFTFEKIDSTTLEQTVDGATVRWEVGSQ